MIYRKLTREGLYPIPAGEALLLAPLPLFWENFEKTVWAKRDPYDEYSKSIINRIAEEFGLSAVFPSDGPNFPPFISWALKSGAVFQSKVGFLVHEKLGLYVSFRGAILGDFPIEKKENPCLACPAPCTKVCPINAITAEKYDYLFCKNFAKDADSSCRSGCAVRNSCIANEYNVTPQRMRFHMNAFVGSNDLD